MLRDEKLRRISISK